MDCPRVARFNLPSRRACVLLAATVALAACAYPRRSTSMTQARGQLSSLEQPPNVWQLRLLSVSVPERQRSGQPWDDDDGPDPLVRVFRDDELVHEWSAQPDTRTPAWDSTPPENVKLPPSAMLRIEVWDEDRVGGDPIGVWRGQGLPRASVAGADVSLQLDSGATLVFRVENPAAHRGTGVRLYELRSDALVMLDVIEFSPAGRAGIRPGDRVVSIDSRRVGDVSEAEAASLLSLASEREYVLGVQRPDGQESQVELDRAPIWLTR